MTECIKCGKALPFGKHKYCKPCAIEANKESHRKYRMSLVARHICIQCHAQMPEERNACRCEDCVRKNATAKRERMIREFVSVLPKTTTKN